MKKNYDIAIVGGGPGGYVAAIRAAQLNKSVALIEKEHLGGTCLNWGCIPTKALLKSAEIYNYIKNAEKYGLEVEKYNFNWDAIINRSREISLKLNKGIQYLIKKNKIDVFFDEGFVSAPKLIHLKKQKAVVHADNIILSTGAQNKESKLLNVNGNNIISYKEAISLKSKPETMAIIGGGAIGLELAHFFNSFDTHVSVFEAMPSVLSNFDNDLIKEITKIFKKNKIEIFCNSSIKELKEIKNKVRVISNSEKLDFDIALVAIGFNPNVSCIDTNKLNIELSDGWIKTNNYYQTSIADIYAIGDLIGPPFLAHLASKQGVIAVEHMFNLNPHVIKTNQLASCIYTDPEIASVGLTEIEAKKKYNKVRIGKFPFSGLGRSIANSKLDGFVKVIFDEKYNELLGCHIIGDNASNILTQVVTAMELETTHLNFINAIHPHPTLSEAIQEAVANAYNESIHI